jgi:hypothetical protein
MRIRNSFELFITTPSSEIELKNNQSLNLLDSCFYCLGNWGKVSKTKANLWICVLVLGMLFVWFLLFVRFFSSFVGFRGSFGVGLTACWRALNYFALFARNFLGGSACN